MSYSITYAVGGVTYNLSGFDPATGLTMNYLGDQGFGLAPMHRITQRGPLQQGDSDIDFRLDPRIMQIPLMVDAMTIAQHYAVRAALLAAFAPSNVVGTLTVTTGATVRAIDCVVLGGLTMDVDAKQGYAVRTIVQLRADDPTWYDPAVQVLTLTPGIAGTAFTVPTLVPLTLGTASINSTSTLTYTGTWLSYPIITAVGPITSLAITSNSTGDVISLGSVAIPGGTTYIIDLRYGFKTVKTATGVNKIGDVTAGSNLATFAIVPAPTVPGGVNSITVSSSASSTTAEVSVAYFTRYVGI